MPVTKEYVKAYDAIVQAAIAYEENGRNADLETLCTAVRTLKKERAWMLAAGVSPEVIQGTKTEHCRNPDKGCPTNAALQRYGCTCECEACL